MQFKIHRFLGMVTSCFFIDVIFLMLCVGTCILDIFRFKDKKQIVLKKVLPNQSSKLVGTTAVLDYLKC